MQRRSSADSQLLREACPIAAMPEGSRIPQMAGRLDWVAAIHYPSRGRPWPALFGKFAPHEDVLHSSGGRLDTHGRCMRFDDWQQMEAALVAVLARVSPSLR